MLLRPTQTDSSLHRQTPHTLYQESRSSERCLSFHRDTVHLLHHLNMESVCVCVRRERDTGLVTHLCPPSLPFVMIQDVGEWVCGKRNSLPLPSSFPLSLLPHFFPLTPLLIPLPPSLPLSRLPSSILIPFSPPPPPPPPSSPSPHLTLSLHILPSHYQT